MQKLGAPDLLITSEPKEIFDLASENLGTVFAYPTETFYGIGCRITDEKAVKRIVTIKGRDVEKGMIVLVGNIMQAVKLAVINPKQLKLLKSFWPCALSVMLEAKEGVNPILSPGGKIALRMSPDRNALELTGMLGPIVSTSANPSGMKPAMTASDVMQYGLDINAVLDGGQTHGGLPSTLVDISGNAPLCIRQGIIPFENVVECWNKLE
jgi:L-threonylcarbamoyladenylate synthase